MEAVEIQPGTLPKIPTHALLLERDGEAPQPGKHFHLLKQLLRFSLVGGFNTLIDILVLNGLLLCFPTSNIALFLLYNALAYSAGAANSFVWNKYWTFQHHQPTTRRELLRFAVTTLLGMGLNSALFGLVSLVLHPVLNNAALWANTSKVLAIAATTLISYLGMRLWVFASKAAPEQTQFSQRIPGYGPPRSESRTPYRAVHESEQRPERENEKEAGRRRGLSVVLPAYNEEEVIAGTVLRVLDVLASWRLDYEIIVVNDGSTDRTGTIVAALAEDHPQVRLITHPANRGYGATLASGFRAATKELTFFMDADGQFDIRALQLFFPFIDEYDAVLGYRIKRQDSWLRKFNAWGWKLLVRLTLDIRVRDLDCAFKLFHTDFLHSHPLETGGALINAELLYRLKQGGYTYREIGVPHLPRQGGRATGAHPRVIARALRDLFIYTRRWRRAERAHVQQREISQKQHV